MDAIKGGSEKARKVVKDESVKTRRELRLLRRDFKVYLEESMREISGRVSGMERALKKLG